MPDEDDTLQTPLQKEFAAFRRQLLEDIRGELATFREQLLTDLTEEFMQTRAKGTQKPPPKKGKNQPTTFKELLDKKLW